MLLAQREIWCALTGGSVKIGAASPYTGLCGCSMEQPYRTNTLIAKMVGMLPGASAEYTSLSMNAQHIKKTGCIIFFDTSLNFAEKMGFIFRGR